MFVFELNTNGVLLTQELLDEFKKIDCVPLIKISFDGRGITLANIHEKDLKEIVKESTYLDFATASVIQKIISNEKCGNCKYFKACLGGCPALGLLYSKEDFDYFHEDITKCYFFMNGWYEKTIEAMNGWILSNPLNI